MNKKEDLINIYSFGLFLNIHLFIYKNIFFYNHFFGSIFYFFLFNLFTKYSLNYSCLEIVNNKLWKNNLNNVVMPLLLNSLGNIIILNVDYPIQYMNKNVMEFIILIVFNYYLTYYYKNEMECCKVFRFNSIIIYFFMHFLF